MKRIKEKIKAIYHIIIDSEYIVLTNTVKNKKRTSSAAVISDNISRITLKCAIELLSQQEGREYE